MTAGGFAAGEGLVEVLGGQHTEDDGDAGVEAGLLDAVGALAGDEVEVGRLAADDAADGHDGVDAPGLGERLGDERDLERAGHPHLFDIDVADTAVGKPAADAVEEPQRHVAVEAAADDRDAETGSVEHRVRRPLPGDVSGHQPSAASTGSS